MLHLVQLLAQHSVISPAKTIRQLYRAVCTSDTLEYLMQPHVCCPQYTVYLEAVNSADVMLQGAQ